MRNVAAILFTGGLGFLLLVIASQLGFGEPPMRSYVVARVVHLTDVVVYPSGLVEPAHGCEREAGGNPHDGEQCEPMVLVGCRFLERRQACGR